MELLGAGVSPFARRIRLLLGTRDYVFRDLNFYDADRETLRRHNPVLKIPALIDGDLTLCDSRVIARYLSDKMALAPLTWAQENQLTVIDGLSDAAMIRLLSMRSGLDMDQDVMFYNTQRERMRECAQWLDGQAADGVFESWDYPAICIYCTLDWLAFRSLFDLSAYTHLQALRERHRQQPMVADTDPRHAG